MTLWNIIPTCPDPMSCYTLVALCAIVSVSGGVVTLAYWWASHEFGSLREGLKGHDRYIEETGAIINKMQIELAVQQSSLADIKSDISEIKDNISETKDDIKILLSR